MPLEIKRHTVPHLKALTRSIEHRSGYGHGSVKLLWKVLFCFIHKCPKRRFHETVVVCKQRAMAVNTFFSVGLTTANVTTANNQPASNGAPPTSSTSGTSSSFQCRAIVETTTTKLVTTTSAAVTSASEAAVAAAAAVQQDESSESETGQSLQGHRWES